MKKNIYQGKFIVVEGLDGSGQSTQVVLLSDFFNKKGFEVVSTKEPFKNSSVAETIQSILDKKIEIGPQEFQEIFIQDRKEHLEKEVIPALKLGKIVVCDRYFFSTFAYGAFEGVDLNWLIERNKEFLLPDASFILKVSPEICIQRIESRGKEKQLFETKNKLEKVWETYKIMPERFDNVYLIDGEKSIEDVFFQIKDILNTKLQI